MAKILGAIWFDSVGIVRVEDEYEGIKYYIKDTYFSKGRTEEEDTKFIADWGLTFPNDAGDALFGVKSESETNVHEWTEKRHY